ncbi:hypothetical protein ES332_A11G344400v1 [Gossypium tomentosum]|uniref:Uncharacterized protein n=1 Tax=Gossypium tomentosum TaxID=34277 RepID=A0A5D2NHB0_GOSTO|nr:hypothetical protein ES332_A11G344400v1 [Gossypium tomentosum]
MYQWAVEWVANRHGARDRGQRRQQLILGFLFFLFFILGCIWGNWARVRC